MIKTLPKLLLKIHLGFKTTSDLALENLALHHQLAAMKRSGKRPQLRSRDRLFRVLLSCFWSNWRRALIAIKSDTVVAQKGFKLFSKFKSLWKEQNRIDQG